MKRLTFNLIAGLFAICFFSTTAHAQLGVKGGVNLASLLQEDSGQEFENLEDKTVLGVQFGAFYELALTEKVALQPEFLYIQKGGKSTFDISLLAQQIENRLFYNYVEVPVLVKYAFNALDDNGLYVIGGPFAGLAVSGKTETEITNTLTEDSSKTTSKYTFDDQDRQKRLDYGVSVGLGMQLGRLILDARYNLGINNLLDNDANNNNDNKPTLRTRGIALTAGFKF